MNASLHWTDGKAIPAKRSEPYLKNLVNVQYFQRVGALILKILQHFAAVRVQGQGAVDVVFVGKGLVRYTPILMLLRAACTNGFQGEMAKNRSHQGFQAMPGKKFRNVVITS